MLGETKGYLLEVLWSDTREVEAVSAMDEKQKNRREGERSPKRHGVRDPDLESLFHALRLQEEA